MFYSKRITTDAGTAKTSPKPTYLKVTSGVITYIGAFFPPGCHGLAHIQVSEGGSPIFPVISGESVAGNGYLIETQEYYTLKPRYTNIQIKTWNEDTRNAHTIHLYITILRERQLGPTAALWALVDLLKKFFQRIGAA